MSDPRDVRPIVDPPKALQFDGSHSPILYLGQAQTGSPTSTPVWQICKIDTTSGVNIQWAGGVSAYEFIWDNRTGLSYS